MFKSKNRSNWTPKNQTCKHANQLKNHETQTSEKKSCKNPIKQQKNGNRALPRSWALAQVASAADATHSNAPGDD
jgi:hypothetical protein